MIQEYIVLLENNNSLQPFHIKNKCFVSYDNLFYSTNNQESFDTFIHKTKKELTKCVKTVFLPASDTITSINGLNYLNTFKPLRPAQGETSEPEPFIEFMKRLFKNKVEMALILQYLSHILQYPEIRPSFQLLLTSDTGTGKGFLFGNILTPILEHQVFLINNYAALTGQFSNVVCDTLLVLIDDAQINSSGNTNRLKSLFSETVAMVEPKGGQQFMQPIYSRFIIATNNKKPFKLDNNERRLYAPEYMTHKTNREETHSFIESLDAWLKQPESLQSIINYLYSIDLSTFNPKWCPITPTLETMFNDDTLESEIQFYADNKAPFTTQSILKHLQKMEFLCTKRQVTELLKANGLQQKQKMINKKREWFWVSNY